MASAMSIVLFGIIIVGSLIMNYFMKDKEPGRRHAK